MLGAGIAIAAHCMARGVASGMTMLLPSNTVLVLAGPGGLVFWFPQ